MPQRISARGRCVPCPAETARLHDSSRKSDSLRRLTLHRPVPATAKPSRLDARPRRSEYNLSWPVYDGRRTEYERQPVTYEATLPAAIRLLIFTSATGKVTSCPEGTTMRSGETAMAILRMTLRDPPDTMEPRRLTSETCRVQRGLVAVQLIAAGLHRTPALLLSSLSGLRYPSAEVHGLCGRL